MSTLRGTEELSLHGFEEPNFVSKTEYNNFRNQYSATLTRRRSRWDSQVVTDRLERTNQFKRFCRKGIPPSNRSEMWMVLSGAKFRMKDNPHVYRVAASKQPIQKLLSVILADLPRTYPENIRFRDENSPKSLIPSLKRVLSAFAVQFPHIGYCQGMNYITAILLLVVSGHGEEAEEKAFWLLDALVNHILPSYYADDMVSVRRDCMVLGQLLRSKDRAVYEMIEKSGANFTMLCAKWFICIYADVLPIETTLRIMDCLFYEGEKILFRAGITLIRLHRTQLLECEDFPVLLTAFRNMCRDSQTLQCHEFLRVSRCTTSCAMFRLPGSLPRSKIWKLRERCEVQLYANR
ncbi:unnamed protein product [Dicrocoelium dendriticum]|nr:unnamed protein product [Dicrocoelium dendriticum]